MRSDYGTFANLNFRDNHEYRPYHGRNSRGAGTPPESRLFIAWDGEGQNISGDGRPQSYTLYGCSTGDYISSNSHLHTFDLLDFIVSVGERFPGAYHVGFAFGYDANMIIRSLSEQSCKKLHTTGHLTLRRRIQEVKYHIQYRPGKWFSVSKYGPKYDREKNPHDKVSVRIFDLFGFFTTSFVKAYEQLVGPVPDVVVQGKKNRGEFSEFTDEYVRTYWAAEIGMMKELAEELRRRLYGAGLRITSWHGPGALASYTLRQHSMKQHMGECPEPIRNASKHAYAGGRFEIFKLGRIRGPIYSVDINSAYPYGIRRLPSLRSGGGWSHVGNAEISARHHQSRIARFGVYHVRLLPRTGDSYFERAPGPLFHRDSMGNISYPWLCDGWYWSPEVANLSALNPNRYEIVEGWELQPGESGTQYPFDWVEEAYQKRLEWKQKGYSTQLALKLMLNSLYGKMAQRVGWNEDKRTPPTWHQLEWAGWVTSHCRAILWEVMSRIPYENLIAVETDGLYTTVDPETLGIQPSSKLGGWTVEKYDEILYVQSGMAWLRRGRCARSCTHDRESSTACAWTHKRRGLDARTFDLDHCRRYLRTLRPNTSEWAPYVGRTTRFIGLGAALNSSAPFKVRHCLWETTEREIRPGQGGKRIHLHKQCDACAEGYTAFQKPHDMSIRSLAYANPISQPHDIPWENDPDYPWRSYDEKGQSG